MKKIILLSMFTLFIVCVYKKDVKALTGNGNYSNPYIVTTGNELTEALDKGATYWKYIAVTDTVAIKEMITVTYGKFRIFSQGGNHTIRRSQSMSATVNSASKPLRCMKIDGDAEVEVGFKANDYKLTINGSKDSFTDSRQCNEWFYVGSSAKLVVCANCIFRNAKNTIKADEAAPIRNYGVVTVYGEIVDCEGNNGGAIKTIGGSVNVSLNAKIHNCKSGTEGGALYCKGGGDIYMESGSIYNNEAKEEGGGIFSTESVAVIYGGSIYNNKAGKTGGGIFSGNNSSLFFGKNGSGPSVSNNYAKNSGGGVRCNGGTDIPGGGSEFLGGTITGNKTDVSGGGISVGKPSANCASKITMTNLTITNNTANSYGGGICFSEGVKGEKTTEVVLNTLTINGNKADNSGGGVLVNTIVKLNNCTLKNNEAGSGGGFMLATSGTLKMPNSIVESNKANKGSGVCVYGVFELSDSGMVNENNTVYLAKNKYIYVTGKLMVSRYLAANIDPEDKSKGTILVNVTYSGGTAEDELYYSGTSESEAKGESVIKKFATTDRHVLRSAENNTQVNSSRFIIISEKYKVKYSGNSLDPVANIPDDEIAFWKEKYTVSNNIVSRIGFVLNYNKHWNLSADGNGKILKPGADTLIDSNTTLYAIWDEVMITSLTMTTTGRYYVVGQKITLDNDELLKKVKVENDLGIDVKYKIEVKKIYTISGKLVASGDDLNTEDYMDTSKAEYFKVKLYSANTSGTVSCTGTLDVYILEDYYDKTEVRFISAEFLDTLDPRSKWNRQKYSELRASLNNKDDYIYTVELDKVYIDAFRDNIRMNGHKIDHVMNYIVSWKVIEK